MRGLSEHMIRFSRSLKVIPGAEEANKVKHREEGKESSGKAETAPLDTMMKVHVCSAAPVLHDSLRSHELQLTRLRCPWDSPGQKTGVGCHARVFFLWILVQVW